MESELPFLLPLADEISSTEPDTLLVSETASTETYESESRLLMEEMQFIPAPPPAEYSSSDDALTAIANFTFQHGYALVKERTCRRNGVLVRICLRCDRGGVYTPKLDLDQRQRERTSRKTGCPFSLLLVYSRKLQVWTLKVRNAMHNHSPSPAASLPSLRKLALREKADTIKAQIRCGVPVRQIMTTLNREAEGSGLSITSKDIQNMKYKMNLEFLEAKSPMEGLIILMHQEENWSVNYKTDNNDILCILCTVKSSMDILRKNSYNLTIYTLAADNMFKMPMLNFLGIDAMNESFHIGFSFIYDQDECWLELALKFLRETYDRLELAPPLTILTAEKCDALTHVIERIFPTSKHLLNASYVDDAILEESTDCFLEELSQNLQLFDTQSLDELLRIKKSQLLTRWKNLCQSKTEAQLMSTWNTFRQVYPSTSFNRLHHHIESIWLKPGTRERFIHVWIDKISHFGNLSTLRSDSTHKAIVKHFKVEPSSDLFLLVKSLEQTINARHQSILQVQMPRTSRLSSHVTSNPLFTSVSSLVSPVALAKVAEFHFQLVRSTGITLAPCSGSTTLTLGIPCIHHLHRLVAAEQSLQPDHFHLRWHI